MEKPIQQRIIDCVKPISKGVAVVDVRVGLGYSSVRLDNGNIGIAWTAQSHSGSCTHEAKAGTLAGRPAEELIEMLASPQNPLSRSLGLATANALAAGLPRPVTSRTDTLELVSIQASDRVVMVGFFGPLLPSIRKTGCHLDVLELNSDKPGTVSPEQGRPSLVECSVAIITATSIITGTMDGLLSGLGHPRAVIVLGPSTFMRPEAFTGTPVTHLAGARIRDVSATERIISEGGGTMILKQHMDFETICLEH
jgi:uncharacterized protein (DUF4213/DUF364 family)